MTNRHAPDLNSSRSLWSLATSLVPPLAAVTDITGGLELTRTASVKIKTQNVSQMSIGFLFIYFVVGCCFFFQRPPSTDQNLPTALFSCSVWGVEMTIRFDCNWTGRPRRRKGRKKRLLCNSTRPLPNALMQPRKVSAAQPSPPPPCSRWMY